MENKNNNGTEIPRVVDPNTALYDFAGNFIFLNFKETFASEMFRYFKPEIIESVEAGNVIGMQFDDFRSMVEMATLTTQAINRIGVSINPTPHEFKGVLNYLTWSFQQRTNEVIDDKYYTPINRLDKHMRTLYNEIMLMELHIDRSLSNEFAQMCFEGLEK